MNLYEHTIITKQNFTKSQLDTIKNKYTNLIKKNNGELIKIEDWGLLNLSYKLGLDNGLLTNGSLLKKENNEQLLKQLTFLRISMAGGNREAYKKVQGRDDFELVIDNLSRIGERKKQMKSKTTLGVAFLANRENADSLEGFVDILINSNCDYLQVRRDNYIKEAERKWWSDNIGKKCQELAKYSKKKAWTF